MPLLSSSPASSSGIPWRFYPLPESKGPLRLRFLFAFPGRHCYSSHSTGPSVPHGPGCGSTWPPATPEPAPYWIRGHRRPFPRFPLSPGKQPLTVQPDTHALPTRPSRSLLHHPSVISFGVHYSPMTGFRRVPIPSIATSTISPGFSAATPRGVPALIMSPGNNVMHCER
jgi:hypothetical protein